MGSFDIKFDLLLVPTWLDYCKSHFTAKTCETYFGVLSKIKPYCPDHFLDRAICEEFLQDILIKGARRTYNSNLTVLRSFGNWYQSQFSVPNFTKDIVYIKEDPPNPRIISDKEYSKIISSTHGQDLDIILFLANTGLRRAEFRKVNWDNFNPDLTLLTIEGKGRKQRSIPLNSICREILHRYKRLLKEPPDFILRYRGRGGVTWLCKRIAKTIGIPRFGPHSLRHYFATQLLKKGISIYKVSKILGHSSVRTTERIYAHLVPTDLLGITESLVQ
jgi:integrase